MHFLHIRFIIGLIILGTNVVALKFNVHGIRKPRTSTISRRGPDVRVTNQLNNTADLSYFVDLNLGGRPFQLLLDSGSSDLWVAGNIPNSTATPFTGEVKYAVGGAKGPIKTAKLQFVGDTIPDQAFLQVTPDEDNKEGDGILGLGPNSGSNIYQEMGTEAGAAVVDRIFLQNRTTPNYLTIYLDRSSDPVQRYNGSITIGEVLKGLENVLEQPKIPVTSVPPSQSGDQHFQVLLDEDGLIGPDGKSISLYSNVASTSNKKRVTAVIDTGFSLPQIPTSASAAIYSRFYGAELVNIASLGNVWIVPCTQEVNITFKFAGKPFPIHPLDATLDPANLGISMMTNSKGQDSCIGTFQPISYDTGSSPNYDMVLGMAFLRNVYALIDYGDFIMGSTEKDDPYMQFLSLTDPREAHTAFVEVRLNGTDTTGNMGLIANDRASSRTVYYVVAIAVVFVISALVGSYLIYRARRNRQVQEAVKPINSSCGS